VADELIEIGTAHVKYVSDPFLKKELTHSFFLLDETKKDPRNITPPDKAEVKVMSGPFYYSVAKSICSDWDGVKTYNIGGNRITLFCNSGLDKDQPDESQGQRFARFATTAIGHMTGKRAAIAVSGDDNWLLLSCNNSGERLMIVLTTDGKRWDAHIRKPILAIEKGVYDKYAEESRFPGTLYTVNGTEYTICDYADVSRLYDEGVAGRFESNAYQKCGVVVDGVMPDMRHSGDQYTTVGNNIINAGACVELSIKVLGVLSSTLLRGAELEACVSKISSKFWTDKGIQPEVNVSTDPLMGDFCSTRLMPVQGSLYCVPRFGKWLARFGVSVSTPRTVEEMRGIVKQFAVFSEVPFIGPVIVRVRALLGEGKVVESDNKYSQHYATSTPVPPPCHDTWQWIEKVYGIGEAEHGSFCASLEQVHSLPWMLSSDGITSLFTTDVMSLGSVLVPLSLSTNILSVITSMSKKMQKSQRSKGAAQRQPTKGKKGRSKNNTKSRQDGYGWNVIHKEETVTPVYGTTSFATTKYAVNPGLATTFPLGSAEAAKMTEWQCDSVEFQFRPSVGPFADNGKQGYVILSMDYSAIRDGPTSLQSSKALHSVMALPTKNLRLSLYKDLVNKADPKYIRTGNAPPGTDIRLYDGGNLWVSTTGCVNTDMIGEIIAKYTFRVRLPNLDTSSSTASNMAMFNLGTLEEFTTTVAETIPFDEDIVNQLGVVNSSGSFVLPEGSYWVYVEFDVADDASVVLQAEAEIQADAASLMPPCSSKVVSAATGGEEHLGVNLSAYVESDGTTAVRVRLTATAASGNIFIPADQARITFLIV
jgi:hypothetical protein